MPAKLEGLIPVDKSNIKAAINTLARAFMDYPDLKYFFPEESSRIRIAPYFFSQEIYYAIRYGEVYSTPDMKGVAIWIRPENYPVSFWKILRSVPLSVIFDFGRYGGSRVRQWGEYLDSTHRRLVPFKHWYLETIGVDPQFKGTGNASKLIKPMLARIDQEGLPCYLETGDEKNVSLYEHFGFKVLEKSQVPGTPLTNWAMLRQA